MNTDTILVMTVGGSDDQLRFTIAHHAPGCIIFIPSQQTAAAVDSLLKSVYGPISRPEWSVELIDDPDDLPSCYRACARVFDRLGTVATDKKIIADATGGTKMMSAALVLAAANYGVTHSYIAGARTKEGTGMVVTGTERPVHTSHPYDLYAVSEKRQMAQFFNANLFEASEAVCNEIVNRSSAQIRPIFVALKKMLRGYLLWDRFKHGEAAHHLASGRNQMLKFLADSGSPATARFDRFLSTAGLNITWLHGITAKEKTNLPYWELMLDLLANAVRRRDEGKYDDAVARFYRATEMIAQCRFVHHFGRSTSRFPADLLPPVAAPELRTGVNREGLANIGSQEAFRILAAMGDEYGLKFDAAAKKIESALLMRNQSILAHGMLPLDREKYDRVERDLIGSFGIDVPEAAVFPKLDPDALLALTWSGTNAAG